MIKSNLKASILELLKKSNFPFSHLVHANASNTEKASIATGFDPKKGIKSLILRGKKSSRNYLVCILGSQKIDKKAFSSIINEAFEFERPEIIKEKYSLEIGGIPPFGALLGIEVFFDEKITFCSDVIFSLGLPSESISMNAKDLIRLINPKIFPIAIG